jgi:hypothetical protein
MDQNKKTRENAIAAAINKAAQDLNRIADKQQRQQRPEPASDYRIDPALGF